LPLRERLQEGVTWKEMLTWRRWHESVGWHGLAAAQRSTAYTSRLGMGAEKPSTLPPMAGSGSLRSIGFARRRRFWPVVLGNLRSVLGEEKH